MFLDKKFIGQKLKEYRKRAKFSQEQLAEKIGLADKHYGRLERGLSSPKLETFFRLVDVLNIPLTEFGITKKELINKNRDNLIREIYMSSDEELEAYIDIFKAIKILKR